MKIYQLLACIMLSCGTLFAGKAPEQWGMELRRVPLSVIKDWIANGFNVNQQMNGGYTPLMVLVDRNELDLVDALIAAGASASINAQASNGGTALMIAASNALYYSDPAGTFKKNNEGIIASLMKAGAQVNIKDKNGATAYDWAVKNNKFDTAKLLKNTYNAKSGMDL